MPRPSVARRPRRKAARRPNQRLRPSRLWPFARVNRRAQRERWRSVPAMKICLGLAVLTLIALATNWIYQVTLKPAELLFPVSGALYKTPAETWKRYGSLFRKYSTRLMTPDLLAAIAQVESSGNPIVRTYWRWSWTTQPFNLYRPASSAVGMYQMTDGTFAQARHYCIRNHAVAVEVPGSGWRSCAFNDLYTRVLPGDAVELTSAYLDRSVAMTLERRHMAAAPLAQQQRLATVIHLCGAAAGDVYASRGFRLIERQHCGDQDVRVYLAQIAAMRSVFDHLARTQSR